MSNANGQGKQLIKYEPETPFHRSPKLVIQSGNDSMLHPRIRCIVQGSFTTERLQSCVAFKRQFVVSDIQVTA